MTPSDLQSLRAELASDIAALTLTLKRVEIAFDEMIQERAQLAELVALTVREREEVSVN